MNKYNIIFPIDDVDKIIIGLEERLEKVHCCYDASITLLYGDRVFGAGRDSIREYLINLKNIAQKVVDNTLQLHASIEKDIGFLLNEELQYKPGLFQMKHADGEWWVGYQYCLSVGGKLGLWLYNDANGRIFFEATPVYPFSYRNSAKDKHYTPYNKWIRGYKPYFITEIPVNLVHQWLETAQSCLASIEHTIVLDTLP